MPAPRSAPPPAPCACSRWGRDGCRGLLAVSGAGDGADRLVLQGMVSLLSLELERRHLLGADRRRERAGALRRILAPGVAPSQAAHLLAVAGLPARVRGLAVEPGAGDSTEVAADLALALPGGLVRVHEGLVEALAVEEVDAAAVLARFARRSAGRRRAGRVRSPGVGLGAGGALGRGRQPPVGSGWSSAAELASVGLLLSLADDGGLRWLRRRGAAAAGAGRPQRRPSCRPSPPGCERRLGRGAPPARLGVHRHTVRNRLDRPGRRRGLAGRAEDALRGCGWRCRPASGAPTLAPRVRPTHENPASTGRTACPNSDSPCPDSGDAAVRPVGGRAGAVSERTRRRARSAYAAPIDSGVRRIPVRTSGPRPR